MYVDIAEIMADVRLPLIKQEAFLTNQNYNRHSRPLRASAPSRVDSQRITNQSLPPATSNRLVTSKPYTTYAPDPRGGIYVNEPKDHGLVRLNSLPKSKSTALARPPRRQSNSAPNQKDGNSKPQRLPKLNNLVNGKLDSTPNHPSPAPQVAAGVSTRQQALQAGKTEKFASSWAAVRAEHNSRIRDDTERKLSHPSMRNQGLEKASIEVESNENGFGNRKNTTIKTSERKTEAKQAESSTVTKDAKDLKSGDSVNDTLKKKDEENAIQIKVLSKWQMLRFAKEKQENTAKENDTVMDNEPKETGTKSPSKSSLKTFVAEYMRSARAGEPSKVKITRTKSEHASFSRGRSRLTSRSTSQLAAGSKVKRNAGFRLEQEVPTVEDACRVYTTRAIIKTKCDNKNNKKSTKTSQNVDEKVRKIPPWRRKEYILNKNETRMYRHIKSVYGNDKTTAERQNHLFRKLEKVQSDEIKRYNQTQQRREKQQTESVKRQTTQLLRVRKKFEAERQKRWQTQYVSNKVLEMVRVKSDAYGLPADTAYSADAKVSDAKPKRRPKSRFKSAVKSVRNTNRFLKLFKVHLGPRWDPNFKTPRMEGIDTVELEAKDNEGNTLAKKIQVIDVLLDAKRLLKGNNAVNGANGKEDNTHLADEDLRLPDLDSLNLSDEDGDNGDENTDNDEEDDDDDDDEDEDDEGDDSDDAFEKAKRKYGIDLDEDD